MNEVLLQLFPNMTLWKLHSPKQYLIFILVLAGGALVFHFWIRRLKKARTPEEARKRVLKAIRSASHGNFRELAPVNAGNGRNTLWIRLPQDVLLLDIIHQGYRFTGSERSEQWTVSDHVQGQQLANPLVALEKDKENAKKWLKSEKQPIPAIQTFVICADNYAEPSFDLDEGARKHVMSVTELKKWIKKRNK